MRNLDNVLRKVAQVFDEFLVEYATFVRQMIFGQIKLTISVHKNLSDS